MHTLKIFMWHFKDNKDLVGVAFIDTEVYIHHATAIKNFILIADIAKSVQLLRYQVRTALCRSTSHKVTSKLDFMFLGLICCVLGFSPSVKNDNNCHCISDTLPDTKSLWPSYSLIEIAWILTLFYCNAGMVRRRFWTAITSDCK